MATELGDVKIRVRLDTEEARRQLQQFKEREKKQEIHLDHVLQKISREGGPSAVRGGGVGRPNASGPGAPSSFYERWLYRRAATPGYGAVMAATQAASSAVQAVRQAPSLPQAAVNLYSQASPAVAAAATYGLIKFGTTAAVGVLEAMKGALPELLRDNPVFSSLQTQVENVARAMDNFESRILSVFTALSRTKDIAFASARLTGAMPAELGDFWARAQEIAVQERDLNLAFDRFKYKGVASGLGAKIRELSGASMREIFSDSMSR